MADPEWNVCPRCNHAPGAPFTTCPVCGFTGHPHRNRRYSSDYLIRDFCQCHACKPTTPPEERTWPA